MSKDVIMPALGMAQETGTLLRWLKSPGDSVAKGELLMEVETDKANVEIEAPASGILADVTAQPGDVIPVGQVIARIETQSPASLQSPASPRSAASPRAPASPPSPSLPRRVSPVAARIAQEHGIDVSKIENSRGVIQKEDVLAFVAAQKPSPPAPLPKEEGGNGRVLASPKARRLANERGIDLKTLRGSGPNGAVLANDVLAASPSLVGRGAWGEGQGVSNIWRVMVERLSNAWTTIPHFYLTRDVNAARLISWRDAAKHNNEKITYTDLLVKLVSAALQKHPRVNASWLNNEIVLHQNINVGLAVAIEQGLTVPVIHNANELSLKQISERRAELIERAHAGKLSLNDLRDGTFTISNLGMYGVDAFNAIVNPPQAAILAVSRIAERVVPVNHQPSVQPMMTLTLSCDHRVVDGARGAQFLDTLAQLIEEPLSLLE
jgi:pyruvate dehydrogenase E2 component (dihydrolipoamide acetyltransferase)